MLKNIRIVMVGTSHPGNIGAAARGIKTMGLDQLCLVAPNVFPHAEVTARAAGADDILAKAQVVDTLEEALVGCRLVLGCSTRSRYLSLPVLNPRECAEKTLEIAALAPVAILFGNEQHGLSNIELQHCHFQVSIPSNPKFSSLNVAAAIQIIAYEINMAKHCRNTTEYKHPDGWPPELKKITQPHTQPPSHFIAKCEVNPFNHDEGTKKTEEEARLPATADDMARFYAHLEQTLIAIHFLDPHHPKKLMQRLHRFFNRAQPETMELNILRGILTAISQKIGHLK